MEISKIIDARKLSRIVRYPEFYSQWMAARANFHCPGIPRLGTNERLRFRLAFYASASTVRCPQSSVRTRSRPSSLWHGHAKGSGHSVTRVHESHPVRRPVSRVVGVERTDPKALKLTSPSRAHRSTARGLTLYSFGCLNLGAASGDIRTKLRCRDRLFRLNPKA